MYSFEIEFNRIKMDTELVAHQSIYVSGICILAKNNKFGGFYFSKYIKSKVGKFHNVCGSNRYPSLQPIKDKVLLKIEGFPRNPTIDNPYEKSLGESGLEYIKHIQIKNITKQ
jgi:hypothetical protein